MSRRIKGKMLFSLNLLLQNLEVRKTCRKFAANYNGIAMLVLQDCINKLAAFKHTFGKQLPFAGHDVSMDVVNLNEKPYIEITLGWMDTLGLRYTRTEDFSHFEIPGGQKIAPFEATIPADFSTAAFPLIAAAVTQSELTILNLDFKDRQSPYG